MKNCPAASYLLSCRQWPSDQFGGPCGGSREDRCEVRPDVPCAWQLIYTRLKDIGQLDRLRKIAPPKRWSASLDGGQRLIVRRDHRI